ncbi:MAG: aldolase/citrate lyase family protein, partial [Sphingopyxis sp.]
MSVDPRSWLFIPGDSAKKLAKAADCGADAVIIDLEDSVAPAAKANARALTVDFLRRNHAGAPHGEAGRQGETGGQRAAGTPQLWVRINPLDHDCAADDVAAIGAAAPHGIVLPKAEGPGDVARLSAMLDALGGAAAAIRIHAIATETPRAIFRLGDFAETSCPRLAAISWGAEDLATAIGASGNRWADGGFHDAFRHARTLAL